VAVPVIVPRADHRISRKDIDPDALKVLYRLHEHKFAAYLVGGSVRDLLLGRRPKDFDIGTSAHPQQIKKLFRNCWIIGRRFRLAHVKFGPKTIEVATFRRVVPAAAANESDAEVPPVVATIGPDGIEIDEPTGEEIATKLADRAKAEEELEAAKAAIVEHHGQGGGQPAGGRRELRREPRRARDRDDHHHDNTFGTPEEDAFRRDFTINGLFYNIADYSVIDYVGGLGDLEARVVRSIGDPRVRFVEDPVRMLRAAVMSARLGFDLDPLVIEAIAEHRHLIQTASPARLLEEYFKILRSGYAEATFRALGRARLLELMTPELKEPSEAIWESLARLDDFRQRSPDAPPEFTNTLLIGALLRPLGALDRRAAAGNADPRGERLDFGMLPIARKDLERLRQIGQITPRLLDEALPPRVARSLPHRPAFSDAVTWLEVFGDVPELVDQWKQARVQRAAERQDRPPQPHGGGQRGHDAGPAVPHADDAPPTRRRRRRRRRGRRRSGE